MVGPLAFTSWTRNPFIVKELLYACGISAFAVTRLLAVRSRAADNTPPLAAAVPVGGMVALQFILVLFSNHRALSLATVGRHVGAAGFFLLVASRAWEVRFFWRLFTAVLLGAVLATVYGLLQFAHLDPISWADSFRAAGTPVASMRIFATFGNPNFFGSHLAMCLIFAVVMLVAPGPSFRRVVAQVALALGAVALLLTLNRGAWVGFVAALAVTIGLLRGPMRHPDDRRARPGWRGIFQPRHAAVVLAAVASLTVVALSPDVRERLLPAAGMNEPTVKSRLLIWSGALAMIRERPLTGFGPGTFGRIFPSFRDQRLSEFHDELTPVTHAHNEYLEVAAETGVFGLLAVVLVGGSAILAGIGKARRAGAAEERLVAGALIGGVASIMISGLFGVELRHANSSFFLWLLLGFLAARGTDTSGSGSGAWRRGAGATSVVLAAAGAVAGLVVAAKSFAGDAMLARAERSMRSRLWANAVAEGRQAQAWMPTETGGLMLAAEALVEMREFAAARQTYLEVKGMNPGEPLVGYNLALMDYRLGDLDAGIEQIERATRMYPQHGPSRTLHYDLLLKKGLALVQRSDYEGAKKCFREAIGLEVPGDPRAYYYLGNVRALEGDYGAASINYGRALRVDPTFRPAAENKRRMEELSAR